MRTKPNSNRSKCKHHSLLTGLLLILCLLPSGSGFLYLRLRNGVQVNAPQDRNILPAAEIIRYRQDDTRWAEDQLGASAYTMRSSGCLVSCIAAALSMEGHGNETPGTLNQKFSSNRVYDTEGNLQWGSLTESGDYRADVFPEVSTAYINNCLTENRYPIVRVRIRGFGSFHYVLIVGARNGEYLCMDPLLDNIVPLSVYGRRVYAVRCVSGR